MLNFEYKNKTDIYFGKGTELRTGEITNQFGKKVLLHYGSGSIKKNGVYDKIIKSLQDNDVDYIELGGVIANPKLELVYEGIELARKEKVDFILAVGGGSVIDSAKAIAAGYYYNGDVWDLFVKGIEPKDALPVGCVLTLAAAGSESSIASIVTNYKTGMKRGLRHELIRPVFAILNPEITYTLPKYQTASGAVDIMAHVIERYFTNTENVELTDRLCESILTTIINNGPIAYHNPEDYAARAEIMWAGTLAHNGLVGTGREEDWASHRLEYEITTQSGCSHGAGLAIVFPHWMRYVYKDNIDRFVMFSNKVFGIETNENNKEETALKGIAALVDYYKSLDMPLKLSDVGIKEHQINDMALIVSANKTISIGNFKKLGFDDILHIYKTML